MSHWRRRLGINLPKIVVAYDLYEDGSPTRYGHARIELARYWPQSSFELSRDEIVIYTYAKSPSLLAQLAPDDDCDYIALIPPRIKQNGRWADILGYPPFLEQISEEVPLVIDFLDDYIVLVGIRPWVTGWAEE